MQDLVTGDDILLPVTLHKNGATFAIDDDAVIKAAIIDKGRTAILAGPFTVSRLETGSNWANSLIVINIPGKATNPIKTGQSALLEIQVDDGGKKTWFLEIKLTKGLI